MISVLRRAWHAAGRFVAELRRRVRERGRSAVFRAGRLTGATVAAFVVAELLGLRNPPPLIAGLTALLVVQATLASTLVNGVQRVLSVRPDPAPLRRSGRSAGGGDLLTALTDELGGVWSVGRRDDALRGAPVAFVQLDRGQLFPWFESIKHPAVPSGDLPGVDNAWTAPEPS
jgi:hypothetical protein